MKITNKVEWANIDSRIEIEEGLDGYIYLTAVYEKDIYLTDEATVGIPKEEFKRLISSINNRFGIL